MALAMVSAALMAQTAIVDPIPRWKPEPTYTKQALRQHICGLLALTVDIDETGEPVNIRVARSLEESRDRNAIKTVGGWIFWPAKKDGIPFKMENVNIDFRFQTKGCK